MLFPSMSERGRLIRVLTPDMLELEGFLTETSGESEPIIFLHIHGMFENFHLPIFFDFLSKKITQNDYQFLSVNTRAKDYFVYFRQWKEDGTFTWKQEGGSYEIFSNCIHDITGWVEFCTSLNKKIVLMGHSHGAIKAAYYVSNNPDIQQIIGLVLISPSDDVGIQHNSLGNKFNKALQIANEMIKEKRGSELMPKWVYGNPLTSEMYMDMFGENSELAIFRFDDPSRGFDLLKNIKIPVLSIFGSQDAATSKTSSKQALELIREALTSTSSYDSKVIEGANHHYLGKEELLSREILDWTKRNFS